MSEKSAIATEDVKISILIVTEWEDGTHPDLTHTHTHTHTHTRAHTYVSLHLEEMCG